MNQTPSFADMKPAALSIANSMMTSASSGLERVEQVSFAALRFEQAGRVFYSTALTGQQLLDPQLVALEKWTPANPAGYQREPSVSRFTKISHYLQGKSGVPGVLPQAVLLGLRGAATFEPIETWYRALGQDPNAKPSGLGYLSIPKSLLPLREVDGQHRLGGLRLAAADARFRDYPMPAVLCEDSSAFREALLFYQINTTSVKVPVDLAQRLIAQQSAHEEARGLLVKAGTEWVARATEIVDVLLETSGQPWHHYILVPGGACEQGVKQNTMVRSLEPLLTGNHVYARQTTPNLATLLVRLWSALQDLWPSGFAPETRRDYVLTKSAGVLTFHALAPVLFEQARERFQKVSPEALRAVLAPLKDAVPESFWRTDGEAGRAGTDAKAVRFLSDHLSKVLQTSAVALDVL